MENEYGLLIKRKGKYCDIELPFMGLASLDKFTVQYKNEKELISDLYKFLEFDGTIEDIYGVYVFSRNPRDEERYGRALEDRLDVKYMEDNFSEVEFEHVYARYLDDDNERIYNDPIRYVRHDTIMNFINGRGNITYRDIYLAVLAYLDDNYRKKRDVYFKLKRAGYKVEIDKVKLFRVKRTGTDLSKFESTDEYFESLRRRVLEEPDSYGDVMDELSGYSIEELRSKMVNPYFGVVDGSVMDAQLNYDMLCLLERCTGLSIDELKCNINGSGRNRR